MIAKIDFLNIFRGHFSTFKNYGTEKVSFCDIALFYVLPAIIAYVVVFLLNKRLSDGAINFLATIFSIFIGLLLNLLVLIFDLARKDGDDVKRRVLHETFSNISYAILISVFLVGTLFLAKMVSGVWYIACCFFASFVVGNFFLTLLMILKRVHALLATETGVK